MRTEILKVTKKTIVKSTYGRNKNTYYRYVAENKNHSHTLRSREDTKLFDLLHETVIHTNGVKNEVIIDGVYKKNKLIFIKNPRLKKE